MTSLISKRSGDRTRLFEKGSNPPDDVTRLAGGLHDPGPRLARALSRLGGSLASHALQTVATGDDRGKRLVHFVGDRCGELAHGHELDSQCASSAWALRKSFLRLPPRGNVTDEGTETSRFRRFSAA